MGRFDYVRYDEHSLESQSWAKDECEKLERMITNIGYKQGVIDPATRRSKALAMQKLEECYAWIGKAVRDDQIARNGSAPLQEERSAE